MKCFTLLAAFVCLYGSAAAQECSFEYGKIPTDELTMTAYSRDPDAEALFLFDDTFIRYDVDRQIRLECYRTVRIKVLKDEGVEWGNVAIDSHYYQQAKEVVSHLEAAAYNLVDGKTVKTPLKKQFIFEEELNENTVRLKFSIPEVRVGTVIEYRYKLISDFIGSFPDIDIQHDIPVRHSSVQIRIPWCFLFHAEINGDMPLSVQRSKDYEKSTGSSEFRYPLTKYICRTEHVPALKKEPFVWHADDFRIGLRFKIDGIDYPSYLCKTFSTTWAEVNKKLKKENFGRFLQIRNPFKEEVAEIVRQNPDERDRLHAVLKLIQSRMTWDGKYRLNPQKSPLSAVANGRGDSGTINALLAAAMRDAGFEPQPVLLNPRSRGRLPQTYATEVIGTFLLRTTLKSGETVYLDATDPRTDVNILPEELLVDRARIYGNDDPQKGWADLTSLNTNTVFMQIDARLTEEGELECTETDTETNQAAYELICRYAGSETHDTFIREYEKTADIAISELSVEGLGSAEAVMKLSFRKTAATSGDHIYIHPTIVPLLSKNPFLGKSRHLPVEFSYPKHYRIVANISLPEGYTIEELPQNTRLTTRKKGVECSLQVECGERTIRCLFDFDMSRIIYPPTEYTDLSSFYGFLADLCNSRIIVKKP